MSKLAEILATKATEVADRKLQTSESELRQRAADQPPARGFKHRLDTSPAPVALIAEVKKASPSEGLIRPDFDPAVIAATYAAAGATCLSVLTDVSYFQGADENLALARAACQLPALRKDFIVDAYQIAESSALGADAILLIVAALSAAQLRDYREEAEALGMDALVEVHTADEAQIALGSGATLIGVNNRDLATFQTDLAMSEQILPKLAGLTAVSESALNSRADVERVAQAGARAVLIGTAFCRSPDIGAKVKVVMGW